jgi:mannan endo-1,4-beta-mannosidase
MNTSAGRIPRLATATVAVVAVAAAGCSASARMPSQSFAAVHGSIPGSRLPLVGVYEKGAPLSWEPVATFASAVGIAPGIAGYYSAWNEPFQVTFARQAWSHRAYVFVQMEPRTTTCAKIAAGSSDAYLRSYADAVRSFGHPVIISFGHEPNGPWYPWGSSHTSAAAYIAAWRHVVDVFRSQGADNVTWLWAVNIGRLSLLNDRYPGAGYINWIGVTGYYAASWSNFVSSDLAASISYVRRLAPGKPVIITETGVAPDRRRPAQIRNLFTGAVADDVDAVIYFDIKQSGGLYNQDWRLEGDPAALAAFRQASSAYQREVG